MLKRLLMIVGALFLGLAAIGTVGLAAPARADATQDEGFYMLLSRDGVVYDFPLVRMQGIAACQREDAGDTPYQAAQNMQHPNGPYTFKEASNITAAANVIYCPWRPVGQWNASTRMYPPPVYPPLVWNPYPPNVNYFPRGYFDYSASNV